MNTQIETIKTLDVFTNRENLNTLLQNIKLYVTNSTTDEGYKEINKIKDELDKIGKEVVDDLKDKIKHIDMERSRAWMFLEDLQKEIESKKLNNELAKKTFEKREANKKHRNKIHKEIIETLYDELEIEKEIAQQLIDFIEASAIPHLRIIY